MNTILDHPSLSLKRVAQSSGGEFAGPCPWCGGQDRFRVWPEHPTGATGGRFHCRQCGLQGDGIQFLREMGMGFREAAEAFGRDVSVPGPFPERREPTWTPRAVEAPRGAWQKSVSSFLARCIQNMQESSGPGLAYAGERNLSPATVTGLGLGWNPVDRWEDRQAWGLEPEVNPETGKPRKVWLPAGLVIPVRRKAGIMAVKVRRSAWTPEDRRPKYVAIVGSSVSGMALGAGQGRPTVVVESELDAILVHQEAGDMVNVLALGSASAKPDQAADSWLKSAPVILVALDWDEAGKKASRWWREHYPCSTFWPVAFGKDVGDLPGNGVAVRDWIQVGLDDHAANVAAKPCPPLAPEPKEPLPELVRTAFNVESEETGVLPPCREPSPRVPSVAWAAYQISRPWLRERLGVLLGAGWTSKELFGIGRQAWPWGAWGVAWLRSWTTATPSIDEAGNVIFTFYEPTGEERRLSSRPATNCQAR